MPPFIFPYSSGWCCNLWFQKQKQGGLRSSRPPSLLYMGGQVRIYLCLTPRRLCLYPCFFLYGHYQDHTPGKEKALLSNVTGILLASVSLLVTWFACLVKGKHHWITPCSEKYWAEAWTVKPGRTGRGIWLLLLAVGLANRELSRQAVFCLDVGIRKNWSLLWASEAWGKHGLRSLHLDCDLYSQDLILKPSEVCVMSPKGIFFPKSRTVFSCLYFIVSDSIMIII